MSSRKQEITVMKVFLLITFLAMVLGGTVNAANSPDLIVQSITTVPTAPCVNQNVTVTVTVKNHGSSDAIGDFKDKTKGSGRD